MVLKHTSPLVGRRNDKEYLITGVTKNPSIVLQIINQQ